MHSFPFHLEGEKLRVVNSSDDEPQASESTNNHVYEIEADHDLDSSDSSKRNNIAQSSELKNGMLIEIHTFIVFLLNSYSTHFEYICNFSVTFSEEKIYSSESESTSEHVCRSEADHYSDSSGLSGWNNIFSSTPKKIRLRSISSSSFDKPSFLSRINNIEWMKSIPNVQVSNVLENSNEFDDELTSISNVNGDCIITKIYQDFSVNRKGKWSILVFLVVL